MGSGFSAHSKPNLRERRRGHHDPTKSTDGHKSELRKHRNGPNRGSHKPDKKIAVTTNPFIIFFLRLRSKKPRQPVTHLARVAGRLWTKMTPIQRQKYVDLAQAEKKRREEKKRRKKPIETSLKK